jgi:hypothetical protein
MEGGSRYDVACDGDDTDLSRPGRPPELGWAIQNRAAPIDASAHLHDPLDSLPFNRYAFLEMWTCFRESPDQATLLVRDEGCILRFILERDDLGWTVAFPR